MDEEYERKWNEYFIDGTNVLKNKLGITDYNLLKQKETDISFERLVELYDSPIKGNFDKYHLCAIHKYIFSDIYPFAGKYRTVYMQKNKSYFTGEKNIDSELEIVLKEMESEFLRCSNFHELTSFLAEYYYDLLVIHPFREGNGRTVREFIREYVSVKMPGFKLDFTLMDKDNLEQGIQYASFSKTLLEMEFSKALVLDEEKENKDAKTL